MGAGHSRTSRDGPHHRAEVLGVLFRFTDRLYRARSPEEVHEAALDAITAALGCERASILLADEAGVMRFVAWRGLSDGYRAAVEGHSPWPPGAADPQPVWVREMAATEEPDALKAVVAAEGVRGLAFIPLTANGALVGKFMTYYPEPHDFTAEEMELAVTLARQLGFALEQRRVDERRQSAETQIREGSERLRTMFQHMGVGMLLTDRDHRIVAANQLLCEILGREREALIGRSPFDFTFPDDLARSREARARVGDVDGPIAVEKRFLRPDGEVVWTRMTLTRVPPDHTLAVLEDVTQRVRAEEHRTLLIHELNHRVKNTLATVQSLAFQTLRGAGTTAQAQALLESRLTALARAHDILTRENWASAELGDVAAAALEPFRTARDRVVLEGPRLQLKPSQALAISIALHELATNAAKYGALSGAEGRVRVAWTKPTAGATEARIVWTESGGPPVSAPPRRGFGSRLIETSLKQELGAPAAIEFRPEGVVATIGVTVPAERLAVAAASTSAASPELA